MLLCVIIGCITIAYSQGTRIHGNCSSGNPFSNYHYNYGTSAKACPPTKPKIDCTVTTKPYTEYADFAGNRLYLAPIQVDETVHSPALGFMAKPTHLNVVQVGLYNSTKGLVASFNRLALPINGQLQYYILPLTKVNSLPPGKYLMGFITSIFGLHAPTIPASCHPVLYYTAWSYEYLPKTVPAGTPIDNNSPVPEMAILGNEPPPPPPPPPLGPCQCTMDIWFDNLNCTNPGNGTAKTINSGNCDHVSLPGKRELSIATAHDCSAFAVYHGKECFGSTAPQYPNRCFNDEHNKKGSYLVTCAPILQNTQQQTQHFAVDRN